MPQNSNRPAGIVVLATLDFIAAVCMLAISAVMAKGIGLSGAPPAVVGGLASRAPFLALLAFLPAVLGLGLWHMQNWARMLTLGFSLVGFVSGFYRLFVAGLFVAVVFGPRGFGFSGALFLVLFRMLASAAVAIYLLRPAVARAFHEAW